MTADLLKELLERKISEKAPEKQAPAAYAIFCSDSRLDSSAFISSPVNRLFVTRNIGNQVIGLMGSPSYPVSHLHSVKLVVVVGHVGCGAVAAAYKMSKELKPQFNKKIPQIQAAVANELDILKDEKKRLLHSDSEEAIKEELASMSRFFANAAKVIGKDEEPYLPRHSEANVNLQVAALLQLDKVREKIGSGEIVVAGAVYDFLGKYGPAGSIYLVNVNGGPSGKSIYASMPEIRSCIRTFLK